VKEALVVEQFGSHLSREEVEVGLTDRNRAVELGHQSIEATDVVEVVVSH